MKKIMYVLAIVAAVATLATSCKKKEEPKPAVDALSVDFAAVYDYFEEYGDYQFYIYDSKDEAPYVIIDVLPKTASFEGTFSTKDNTIDLDYTGIYLNAEDTASIELTSIEITIAKASNGYNIKATIVSGDKTYEVAYTGDVVDANYMYESTTAESKEASFDVAEAADYTAYLDYGYGVLVYLGEYGDCGLNFLVEAVDSATVVPVGTYKINASGELGTCAASTGYGYMAPDECYFYTVNAAGTAIDKVWFLQDGTVTVSKEGEEGAVKIVVDAKSYFGSSIKVTYTGKIELAAEEEEAPAAKSAPKAARKVVRK